MTQPFLCDRCGEPIDPKPGETYCGSTNGRVWHYGCAPSTRAAATQPFPPDLPDLLRIACRQGRMRLNVFFSAERKHQANLANAGNGWATEYGADPLEAIAKVLRQRFGRMLEREQERAAEPALPLQIDLEEAIAAAVAGDDVDGLIG